MASKRIARLNEQLKRELSEMIRMQVRDPRVGPVTVTGVDTAGDIGSAKVYVRIIGDEAEVAESLSGLEASASFLRHQLGQVLRIRKVPELRFREDHSLEQARRIEEILSEVIPGSEGPIEPAHEGAREDTPADIDSASEVTREESTSDEA